MKIKLLKQFMFLGIMLFGSVILAQTVSGTITGDDGPLPGVNVLVKGTTNGVSTDFDGNYTIDNVGSDAVLEFSFVGFTTQSITVNGQSTIDVQLAVDAEALDEVIVIGYGTTTVKDATGAVASVSSKDFNGGAIVAPEQLIQGKVAGVQITQSSGEPGAGIAIRIRGTNSVRSNNNPLYVVDGVPLSGENTSAESGDTGFGSSSAVNPLSFLNPSDIESISILKDASATAIYGSRGANGVVIVTTKKGRGQGGRFEFNSAMSSSSPANRYNLLGAEDFLGAVTQFGGNAAAQDFGANTDWQDVVTRTSFSHDQNFAYSRAYDNGSVRATIGYQDLQGILENSSLQRISGRLNLSHRFFDDKLKLNLQSTISNVGDELPAISGNAGFQGDLLGSAYSANPTWPNDPDFDSGGQRNPANMLKYIQNTSDTDRILLNFSADYDLTSDLNAKITLGYDKSKSTREVQTSGLARNAGDGIFGTGYATLSDLDAESKLLELTLTWDKEFGNSKLNLLAGYSFQDFQRSGRNVQGWGYNTTNMNAMAGDLRTTASSIQNSITGSYQQYGRDANGGFINRLFPNPVTDVLATTGVSPVSSIYGDFFDTTDEIQSFFTRGNYTIANKYLFTGTVRIDGSSRFGSDNQYGIFPSAAFAWKINEEDFIGDAVSLLKARVSWGITGNQDGLGHGNFIRRERYAGPDITGGGDINTPGLEVVSFANPALKWEETTSYGFGIDFGLNNDRLTGSFDLYRSETQDILLRVEAAQPSPQPFFFINLDAIVLNQGVEFSINYDFFQTDDFTWSAGFNIAYNENEMQDFGGQIPAGTINGQGLSQAFSQILAGNQPLFSYFLREFEGFDANGQPIGDNQTFVGKSALPTTNFGLSTNLTYKNWDFSAFLTGQSGFYIYNNTANAFFTAGAIANARNVTPNVLTSGEAGNAEAAVSTRFLEKGNFVRLQNATIGYTVPIGEDSFLNSLRFYLTGQNLFLITDYTGLDPELSTNPGNSALLNNLPTAGIDYTSYPRPRVFTLGLNVTF
ncbi:MAG: SusC/RagA family TonB-linked outer membrane protein [Flavobacteriaceae bacterium]|nr:SusC/RagA family TonB-linked outer membrane protein [Flavobacteriaceae bacterium]